MSGIQHFKGKLTPTGKTLQEYNSCVDHICDLDSKAVEIDGLIYTVDRQEFDPYDSIFLSTKNNDGTIDFEVKYYNGDGGFHEAIDEALK